MVQIGKDLVDGIGDGIKQKAREAKGAAGEMLDEVTR